ncbi:MAG: hypothetical protein IKE69_11630 [Thermoguttaceae bacterium]|nr:hypothetical protein [Thermoguttaceae bacterium]
MFSKEKLQDWTNDIIDIYDDYHSYNALEDDVLEEFLDHFGLAEAWEVVQDQLASNWKTHLKNLEENQ